jgi:hypothetical protein
LWTSLVLDLIVRGVVISIHIFCSSLLLFVTDVVAIIKMCPHNGNNSIG